MPTRTSDWDRNAGATQDCPDRNKLIHLGVLDVLATVSEVEVEGESHVN